MAKMKYFADISTSNFENLPRQWQHTPIVAKIVLNKNRINAKTPTLNKTALEQFLSHND